MNLYTEKVIGFQKQMDALHGEGTSLNDSSRDRRKKRQNTGKLGLGGWDSLLEKLQYLGITLCWLLNTAELGGRLS